MNKSPIFYLFDNISDEKQLNTEPTLKNEPDYYRLLDHDDVRKQITYPTLFDEDIALNLKSENKYILKSLNQLFTIFGDIEHVIDKKEKFIKLIFTKTNILNFQESLKNQMSNISLDLNNNLNNSKLTQLSELNAKLYNYHLLFEHEPMFYNYDAQLLFENYNNDNIYYDEIISFSRWIDCLIEYFKDDINLKYTCYIAIDYYGQYE